MAEWLYKATQSKATLVGTQNLALLDNFIARSAYEANGSKADNVWNVVLDDLIHLYYREKSGKLAQLGTYQVSLPPQNSARFDSPFPQTALVPVLDPAFQQRCAGIGYAVDPVVHSLLGWFVIYQKLAQPSASLEELQHNPTLIRYP